MIKFRRIMSKLRTHKRLTIIAAALILTVFVVVGVFLWSQKSWSDYATSNSHNFSSLKADIDETILKPLTNMATSQTDKLNSITKVKISLTERIKPYCEVNPLIKWQSFISQYSDKINNCQRQKERLGRLLGEIGNVVGYLKSEQALAAIMSSVNEKTNQDSQADKWNLIEAFWRQAVTDVSKLPDTKQFSAIKLLASDKISKVADAWQQISTVNGTKDRQQFGVAHSNLDTTYAALTEISDSSKAQIEKLIASLNTNYKEAF